MIATPRAPWPSWKRFVLRFAFVYVGLLSFSFPLSQLPGVKPIAEWLGDRLYVVLDWMVLHIFGVVPAEHTRWEWNGAGHGDGVAENLAYLSCAILALLGATAWSIVDRRRGRLDGVAEGLRVLLRYTLAATLLVYGVAKFTEGQFSEPTAWRLLRTYGESSPMGLLWTFMGASQPYTMFAGVFELVGGVLVLFRRTTLIGALIAAGVMTNVLALDICYDVPVKMFTAHVLLMAALVILPDARRLLAVLLGRAAQGTPARPHGADPRVRVALELIAVALILYGPVMHAARYVEERQADVVDPRFGAYRVDDVAHDGVLRPLLTSDALRWRVIAIGPQSLAVRTMTGERRTFALAEGAAPGTLIGADGDLRIVLGTQHDGDRLRLAGLIGGDTVIMRLTKIRRESLYLVQRGGMHRFTEQVDLR